MRYYDDIIIHCTNTREGRDVHVDEIRGWHRQYGWEDCGYHYIVTLDGSVEVGRPLEREGQHCKGHNRDSVAVAYVGGLNRYGLPADTRTPAQRKAIATIVWNLTVRALNAGFGLPSVHGHRDYTPNKDCPCFDAAFEYGG